MEVEKENHNWIMNIKTLLNNRIQNNQLHLIRNYNKTPQEAIEGYDKVLDNIEDEKVKDNLEHIRDEEVAHKEYLDAAKEDPTVDYEHEESSEE